MFARETLGKSGCREDLKIQEDKNLPKHGDGENVQSIYVTDT
jgi:hypothetical protein